MGKEGKATRKCKRFSAKMQRPVSPQQEQYQSQPGTEGYSQPKSSSRFRGNVPSDSCDSCARRPPPSSSSSSPQPSSSHYCHLCSSFGGPSKICPAFRPNTN